jgi:hypothetical protein
MIIDEDDLPLHQAAVGIAHAMDGHPNAYDRFWFNGYTDTEYFAVALGLYPNRGVIDAAFAHTDGATQRSVFAGDLLSGRPTSVGPVRVEIVEPMRVNRIVVDAPDQGLLAELTYRSRTSAFEEARQTMHDGPRIFMDVTRATQLGTWDGWIEVAGRRVDVSGWFGTKDRSWGVRPIGEPIPGAPSSRAPQLCFVWTPINFPDGALHYMSFDDDAGHPVARTCLTVPLKGDATAATGQLELAPLAGTRRVAGATLFVDHTPVHLEPRVTFHMRGAGYTHPQYGHGRFHGGAFVDGEVLDVASLDPLEFPNLHVQQVVVASRHGVEGLGVLESLIIGPYSPMGLTGLVDGAPGS